MRDRRPLRLLTAKRAVAMVTVLIFIILVSMVAATSIFLMTNQARLVEKQVRRIKAYYSAQAADVQANDELFNNSPLTPGLTINNQTVAISHDPLSAPIPGKLNTSIDFSF